MFRLSNIVPHNIRVSRCLRIIMVLISTKKEEGFLCFFGRASRYNRVKKNQLDRQLILSIFRQTLHVQGVSRLIIRRYNCMYTTIGTYYSF